MSGGEGVCFAQSSTRFLLYFYLTLFHGAGAGVVQDFGDDPNFFQIGFMDELFGDPRVVHKVFLLEKTQQLVQAGLVAVGDTLHLNDKRIESIWFLAFWISISTFLFSPESVRIVAMKSGRKTASPTSSSFLPETVGAGEFCVSCFLL